MKYVKEYKYMSKGRELSIKVEYDLVFNNRKLSKVYNEYHHSIAEGSELFNFFKKTYER